MMSIETAMIIVIKLGAVGLFGSFLGHILKLVNMENIAEIVYKVTSLVCIGTFANEVYKVYKVISTMIKF